MPVVVPERTNRRVRNPIPKRYVDAITKESVHLINLSPISFVFGRSYGQYVIKGVRPDEEYTSMPIFGRLEMLDEGDEKYGQQLTEAGAIGEDLARQANEGILCEEGVESFIGVFVSPTAKPGRALLDEMTAKLMAFYDAQIRLADTFWDSPADHKQISSLHRRAAKARNQTRPWTYEVTNMASCPACSASIPQGMAICKSCGALLDEGKARRYFPQYFQGEAETATPKPRRQNKPAEIAQP